MPEAPAKPPVENRSVTPQQVRVRALQPLGEPIGGEIRRFEPGEQFELPPERAKALGPLVETVN